MLPLVGSMIVAPGLRTPDFSAASTIERAMRSLTLPPGLKYSTFASTFAPPLLSLLDISMSGVPPTFAKMFFAVLLIDASCLDGWFMSLSFLSVLGLRRLQKPARTEPEKSIQMEKTFAGSAATGTPIASAPAMPPFWSPTSIATVRASTSPMRVKRAERRVSQYPTR